MDIVRKLLLSIGFGVFLFLISPLNIRAGFLIPAECTPQLVDGVKMIVCPEGTVLTPDQQARIDEMNARIAANQLKNQNKIQAINEQKEQIQIRIEDKRASIAAKLQVANQERIRAYFGILIQRVEATIERLELLISRMEARLVIFSEQYPEEDITQIQADIEAAKDLLMEAKADIEAAEESLEDVLTSEDPKEAFQIVKETILDIKSNLVDVHSLLVHALGDIKGLRVGATENAGEEI